MAQRLASRIHTEAFRVSRIIDDLLDLSRIESEEAPPREPVPSTCSWPKRWSGCGRRPSSGR